MAGRRKNYVASELMVPNIGDEAPAIEFETDSRRRRTINHADWIGRGLDGVVSGCLDQLKTFQHEGVLSVETIVGYGRALKYFYAYLYEAGGVSSLDDIKPMHIELFVQYLKAKYPQRTSAKSLYDSVKPVLMALIEQGKVKLTLDELPRNPFPGSNSAMKGEVALSAGERERLASALKNDLIAIHRGEFDAPDSEAMSVYVLLLALRTGANTAPLLTLKRACLKPHPFLPNVFLLETFKRRGNATHHKVLRYSEEFEDSKVVKADAVAILQKALLQTECLVAQAPADISDSVWLYRSARRYDGNRVTRLTEWMLSTSIENIVARHGLLGDDGMLLRLNLQRLRKTLAARVWALSNGDVNVVAALLGNRPEVADQSYLAVTDVMRQEATTVSEDLVRTFRQGHLMQDAGINTSKTPVGRCLDSLMGERAPKDGVTHCAEFLHCLSCSSFAMTSDRADMHRLFSFLWYLYQERERIDSPEWKSFFAEKISVIERIVRDAFTVEDVDAARRTAFGDPLIFWRLYAERSMDRGRHA